MEAVKQDGYAIRYIKNNERSEEIIIQALMQNKECINYLK